MDKDLQCYASLDESAAFVPSRIELHSSVQGTPDIRKARRLSIRERVCTHKELYTIVEFPFNVEAF